MNESEATPFAEQLAKAVGTGGTLRFFGDWFGRPHDNIHLLESATVDQGWLVIHFDGGDVLRVWQPQGLELRLPPEHPRDYASPSLVIRKAGRVRWESYYYGRPKGPENLRFIEYVVRGRNVERRSNWEHRLLPKATVDVSSPAVELY
jgi:hypothetical protein